MKRTAWELFQDATLSLARSGALKDRLSEAYQNHLARVDESELPKELRDEFRSFSQRLTREPPLLRGEGSGEGHDSQDVQQRSRSRCNVHRSYVLRAPAQLWPPTRSRFGNGNGRAAVSRRSDCRALIQSSLNSIGSQRVVSS